MRALRVLLLALVLTPAPASAITQSFYLHYGTNAVSVPGGSTQYYMNQTTPGGTPTILGPVGIAKNASTTFTFTSQAVASGLDLERLNSLIVNISANHVMTGCANVDVTLSRLDATGNATTLASGSIQNVTITQGSGGGLQGYTAVNVPLLMGPDRTIVSGGGIKASIQVTNSCGSTVSIRIALDGTVNTGTISRTDFETPDVTLYGPPNSFGSYNTTISRNGVTMTLARSPVATWATDHGLTIYLGTAASDGSVFIGDYFYNLFALTPTSCSMAITCFNPWSKQCPAGASNDNFANIRIPYGSPTQYFFDPPSVTAPGQCLNAAYRGGSDIADVQTIDDGEEKLMFISSRASFDYLPPNPPDPFPAVGRLRKIAGTWTLDSPRHRADLQTDPAGPQVCSGSGATASCGALSEFKQLPGSGHIVIAQYGGGIATMDRSGHLVGHLAVPPPTAQYDTCNIGVIRAGKTVAVDPTSVSSCGPSGCSDERFVISYDAIDPTSTDANPKIRSAAFQEFRYDTTVNPPVITPVTAPMFATTAQYPSTPCVINFGNIHNAAVYDDIGNLWVSRSIGVQDLGVADVFVRDPVHGRLGLANCATSPGDRWGVSCVPDQELVGVPTQVGRQVQDPVSGAMFYGGIDGTLATITRNLSQPVGQQFALKSTVVDLVLTNLNVATLGGVNRGVFRPLIDGGHRTLWLPIIAQSATLGAQTHNTWLFAVDIDRLLARP